MDELDRPERGLLGVGQAALARVVAVAEARGARVHSAQAREDGSVLLDLEMSTATAIGIAEDLWAHPLSYEPIQKTAAAS